MSRNNVTMIDDLPFIDDIESKSFMTGVPSAEMKQVSKFIRDTTYNPPYESGMMAYNNNSNRVVQSPPPPPPQPQQQQQRIQLPPAPSSGSSGVEEYQPHQMIMSSLSCVDVAEHAANCIVCSRLYNTDMTLYIIIISILLLTIVILIKKVLDCPSR